MPKKKNNNEIKKIAKNFVKEVEPKLKEAAKEFSKDVADKVATKGKEYANKVLNYVVENAIPEGKKIANKAYKYAKDVAVPKGKEYAGKAYKYTKEKAIPNAKKFVKEKATPAVKNAYEITKKKTNETSTAIKSKTVSLMDINGDGKIDQEDMVLLLDDIYGKSINGIKKVSKPVEKICSEYLKKYKDPKIAAQHLAASDITKCTTSGFITGFGGAITLPVTIPANVASVLYVQIRMIASIASLSGLDVNSDATQTLVYACLAGISVADVVKQVGIKVGTKVGTNMIKKIPGKTLTAINQKVGFRMLTKFGETGVINFGKMIPVIGAVVGGGFDLIETKIIANRAIKQFFGGDFSIKNDINKEIIDAEFTKIIDKELSKA